MKRSNVLNAVLGLTVLLTACSSSTPVPVNYSLTLNLAGVTKAAVTVTNTTSNTQVFMGTIEGSKTFSGLSAGSVLNVEAGNVDGYTAPKAQSVQLDDNKTVNLTYAAVPKGTYALTLNVNGTPAPVTVTEQGTNRVIFTGTITGTQTIHDLPANTSLKVEGAPVDGFVTPAAQTFEMISNKSISLAYIAPQIQAFNARLTPGATAAITATASFPTTLAVTATVTGLPAWITARSQEVTLTAAPQPVSISLTANSSIPAMVQTLPAQLVLTERGHVVGQQSIFVTVLPTPMTPPSLGNNSNVTLQGGAYWYTDKGDTPSAYRIALDGSSQSYTFQGASPYPVAGEDGFMHFVYQGYSIQLDPVTGKQVTSRIINPKTDSRFIDARGRGWENYFGIYRNDYQPCPDPCDFSTLKTPVVVPGTTAYSNEVVDVRGTTVWIGNFTPGSPSVSRLIRMNGDTLEQTTVLEMDKLFDLQHVFARPSGIWLSHYGIGVPGGGPIARVNESTGAVETFEVIVNGAPVSSYETLGVTDEGKHLLLIVHSPFENPNQDEYVLYNPLTQTVEKRLVLGGSNSGGRAFRVLTDRSGRLWIRGTGAADLPENALYVY